MTIDDITTCHILNDIKRSRITSLFKPMDDEAKELLRESALEDQIGCVTEVPFVKPVTVRIAIYTAMKGETLISISQKIIEEGWQWGALVDWYRYLEKDSIKDSKYISLPGEIYRDDDFKEWYPRVSSHPKTIGRALMGGVISLATQKKRKVDKTIAEVLMKPLQKLVSFQGETRILIVKIDQGKSK